MYQNVIIKGYKEAPEGTYLVLVPHESFADELKKCTKNGIIRGELRLDDPRYISSDQRKKAYATMTDIATHTGHLPEEAKEWLKYLHISKTGCNYFSLANCSMTTARDFINTLLDYALENGVMLEDLALNRTDDIGKYLYSCLKYKRCCLCGYDGEVHHIDSIGAGNNRKTLDDSKHLKMCLCRKHHTEVHKVGVKTFCDKHKVYGILFQKELGK